MNREASETESQAEAAAVETVEARVDLSSVIQTFVSENKRRDEIMTLMQDGRLGRFKAEIRSAVMSILNRNPSERIPVQIPEETKLINELIREYMVWNGYLYSEQVLVAESAQHSERLPRENLATKLNVMDDDRTVKIPLLYYVLAAFQNNDEQ
ncbi:fop n terminal dimerization domain [Holotrichia oblita]|uniref:Fop n terminal dimerization domain n=1 Tax=Holotrichia oblita TaxID=644536 RepID=A0ACB9SMV3_HOLOL|nr:fop n terminal dimerization domain [Holotrichia oblita]